MHRRHLFEWEDLPGFPSVLRDLMTDYLRHAVQVFGLARPVVPILEELLERTGQRTIIDLASGGGGPWRTLAPALRASHPELRIVLSDLHPNVAALEATRDVAGPGIEVRHEPLDARTVPGDLEGLRTQFLSLHHFEPDDVRAMLGRAVAGGHPIAAFEFQARSLGQAIQFALSPIFVLILSLMIRPFRWRRLLFTYLIPLVPLLIMWDGIVSVLRTYTVQEVNEIIATVPGGETYTWDVGIERSGPATVFRLIGVPRADG
jgi:hypothetical protein